MSAIIGLALFALIIYAVYCAVRFLASKNLVYGRRMIYSVVASLVLTGLIVIV